MLPGRSVSKTDDAMRALDREIEIQIANGMPLDEAMEFADKIRAQFNARGYVAVNWKQRRIS